MLQLNLSQTEIEHLNYERYHYPCPIVQKRITAVYFKYLGMSNGKIASLVSLNRKSVGEWLKCYHKGGFEALCRFNYGTNKSDLDQHSRSILDSFSQEPPKTTNEAKMRIEKLTGISRSPSQVRSFMKRHGLRYLQTGHIPAKADSKKQRIWVSEVLDPAIEQAQKGECALLFMDAAHFILQPFICALWCKIRLFIKASAGRNRINVLGALDAITKQIHTFHNTSFINAVTIITFFKQLRNNYGEMPLKIVLDNARYQHCNAVKEASKSLDITLLFLPSYSPNLNIIERLWKFTKKKILYAKYYETPKLFHEAITTFFESINQKHKEELNSLLTLKFQYFEE